MTLDQLDKLLLILGCLGLVIASAVAMRFWLVKEDVESYLADMRSRYVEATPNGDMYDRYDTNEELLDAIVPAQRRLVEIELEFCRRAGCRYGDGSEWWDRISAAVRDGRGQSELLKDLNRMERV